MYFVSYLFHGVFDIRVHIFHRHWNCVLVFILAGLLDHFLFFLLQCDAGAEVIVTQLFYDTDGYLKFVNDCRQIGIKVPVVPGIMPIQNYKGFLRMTSLCKTKVRCSSHVLICNSNVVFRW